MGKANLLGPWGEATAAEYLRKKRYELVAAGYRSRFGEIDLIVKDRKYLIFVEVKLRKSSDFAKAIAMGADAVAIASAAMVAAACQQYRICGTGMCPVGMATQDEKLRERLHIDSAAKRVENFLTCSASELRTFARITGNSDIHDLSVDDLCTINREISEHTNILHA